MSKKYNTYNYCLTYKEQFAERLIRGFGEGNYSDDGDWVIGDKEDNDMNGWCIYDESKTPQWIKDILASFDIYTCCFGHEVALKIIADSRWTDYRVN